MSKPTLVLSEAATGAGPRQAALLLHAMPGGDREWLLGTLAPAQRTQLETMLSELRSLGIPPSAALLREALRREQAAPPAVPALVGREPAARAVSRKEVSPRVLHEVLCKEPDVLVCRFLRRRPDRERQAVLAEFESPRREALRQALRAASQRPDGSPNRLNAEIEVRVSARAAAREAAGAAGKQSLSALAHRLGRWNLRHALASVRSKAGL